MRKTFRPFRIHGKFVIYHAHGLMWNYQENSISSISISSRLEIRQAKQQSAVYRDIHF
jgi:hypothetical protein